MDPEEIERAAFPVARRGYDTQSVRAFLHTVAVHYRQALDREVSAPPPPPPPPPSYAEELGDRVATVLQAAAEVADQVKSTAEREAQGIRRAASEEAAEASQAAMRQLEMANEARVVAEREAEAIRAAARSEAQRLELEAREHAAVLESEAREKAARLERTASVNVTAVLAEARTRYERLRAAEQKSAIRLAAVESLARQAREEVTSDGASLTADEIMAGPIEEGKPNAITVSTPGQDSPPAQGGASRTARRPRPTRRVAPLGLAQEEASPRPRRGRA